MKNAYELEISNLGTKTWYYNDEIHRDKGPAIQYKNGDSFYYKRGFLHNENGGAIKINKNNYFFLNGVGYSGISWGEKTNHLACRICYIYCKQLCFYKS